MTNRFKLASRKLISIAAIVAMVITSISFVSLHNNAYASTKTAQVGNYTIALPSGASLNGASASTEVTKLDPHGSNTLAEGWYVFEGMNDFNNGIVIEGDCNIILADGCHVSVSGSEGNAGIQVSNGASLTIWSGSQKTGMLTAEGGKFAAGIGGSSESKTRNGSNITINGGNIVAYGGNGGAGIGGGASGNGNNIRINDGYVLCYAENAYGIGGGFNGTASNIVISKSRLVKAGTTEAKATVIDNNGSDLSNKIASNTLMTFVSVDDYTGNSDEKNTSDSGVINTANRVGSYVVAVPDEVSLPDNASRTTDVKIIDSSMATLTDGWYIVNDDVTIDGRIQIEGNVNIILGDGNTLKASAGIQVSGDDNSLTIWSEMGSTGLLESTGASNAAGIGGDNDNANCNNITINGGNINAVGGNNAAGIGGGSNGSGHNITINGGVINANAGTSGAGIGGGYGGSGNNITITGGNVTANGDNGGTGIGGGYKGSASQINIKGGYVSASGSSNSELITGKSRAIGIGFEGRGTPKIKIATSLVVKAKINSRSNAVILANNNSDDYSARLVSIYHIETYPRDGWSNSISPDATSIKSLKSYKKSVKVTWATKTDISGYQILYKTTKSKTKNYKIVNVKSDTASTKTITKLKRHTRYYVKIRTYVAYSDGYKDCSAWSKLKSVKTK